MQTGRYGNRVLGEMVRSVFFLSVLIESRIADGVAGAQGAIVTVRIQGIAGNA